MTTFGPNTKWLNTWTWHQLAFVDRIAMPHLRSGGPCFITPINYFVEAT
jgi:hypothetical protein